MPERAFWGMDAPIPPLWHPHPLHPDGRDYHRFSVESRAYLRAWVNHALSSENREYRLTKLAAAVGLGVGMMRRYIEGEIGIGSGLAEILIEWASDHLDLSLNDPTDEVTFLANLGDLG